MRRALAISLAMSSTACRADAPPSGPPRTTLTPDAATTASEHPRILFSSPRVEPGAPPARYGAAIPLHYRRAMPPSTVPPERWVQAKLCAGDEFVRAKHLARLREAVADAELDAPDAAGLVDLYDSCLGEEDLCGWLAGFLGSDTDLRVRRAMWHVFAYCEDTDLRDVALHDDAPAEAVVRWLGGLFYLPREAGPVPARVARAIAEITSRTPPVSDATLLSTALAVGRYSDPDPRPVLQRLADQATLPEYAGSVWLAGLEHRVEDWAIERIAEICANPETQGPRCEEGSVDAWTSDTDAAFRNYVAVVRPADLAADLEACVRESPSVDEEHSGTARRTCLGRLAEIDASRALALVREVRAPSPDLIGARAYLERAAKTDIARELEALGLLATGSVPSLHAPLSVGEVLVRHGRGLEIDVWLGDPPFEIDVRLTELASLVPAELGDAIFVETTDAEVQAFHRGLRYAQVVNVADSRVATAPIVGLLNVLLRDAGSPLRFVDLGSVSEGSTIIAVAPSDAWEGAFERGLFEAG
jgi:hypothetical protein